MITAVPINVAIVTISDSAVAGTREDRSGAALAERVVELGWTIAQRALIPDTAEHSAAHRHWAGIDPRNGRSLPARFCRRRSMGWT